MTRGSRGFTLVEVLVAIVVLMVGVLALMGTSGMLTVAVKRAQRAGRVAAFAASRAEDLRTTACASQAPGVDTLYTGTTPLAVNRWQFTDAGNSMWRVLITTTYTAARGRTRTDKLETGVSCRF